MRRFALGLVLVATNLHAAPLKTTNLVLQVPAMQVLAVSSRPTVTAEQLEPVPGAPRGEQEQILRALIDDTPDSDVEEKSDYMFRLAELYNAQARFARLKGDERKRLDTQTKAIAAYQQLLAKPERRNYPKADLALFHLGSVLLAANQPSDAKATYDQLIKDYPNSRYVPEAYLAVADFQYEAGQLPDAEARYKQVLKYPKSAVYWFAMYKMGWIHFAGARYQDALQTFFQVVQGTNGNRAQDPVNRAAKLDFARAYAEIGKVDKALPAFQRVDNAAVEPMMVVLAEYYVDHGKHDQAIVIYRQLITRAPDAPDACAWMAGVARAAAFVKPATPVAVCTIDVPALKKWARDSGGSAN